MTHESGTSIIFIISKEPYDYTTHYAEEEWKDIGSTQVIELPTEADHYVDTLAPVKEVIEDRLTDGDNVIVVGTQNDGLHAVATLALFPDRPVQAVTICTEFDLANRHRGGQSLEARARRWIREGQKKGIISPHRVLTMIDPADNAAEKQLKGAIVFSIPPGMSCNYPRPPILCGLIDHRAEVPKLLGGQRA
jgi:hypothetical protein